MRRLVNNFLFGETSKLLAGRIDSDVYGNSCAWLENMYVHRQGGISRRPPLKGLSLAGGYVKGIPFIVDKTHVYAVLLGEGVIGIYDYRNNTLDETLELPFEWLDISDNECKQVRYAQYYNDLYIVHGSFPMMRVRYTGSFIVSEPQVFVNQDIGSNAILLTFTMTGVHRDENVSFTFDGVSHSFDITDESTMQDIADEMLGFDYDGYSVKYNGTDSLIFTPEKVIDRYRQYDFDDPEQFGFSDVDTFTTLFTLTPLDDESGTVYGTDDFHDFYLNRTDPMGITHYPSDIAIAAERMFLTVNGNPSMVYGSRPYGTSQIVYPRLSNDSILDFIQFEFVTTSTSVMKDDKDLPVVVAYDSGGYPIYEGKTTDQKLWFPPAEDRITTKGSLDEYRNGTYVNGEYVPYSANELVCVPDANQRTIVSKIRKVTTTEKTLEDYIERRNVYYRTYDEEVDTSKLNRSVTGVFTTDKYFSNTTGTAVVIDDAGTYGLKNVYEKTTDRLVNTKAFYYTRNGNTYTLVDNPVKADLGNYYEKTVEFTNLNMTPVYEYGPQYVYSANGNQLRVEYLDNGMIGSLSYNGSVDVAAIPYYQYDMSTDSDIFEDDIEVDKVATASTGIAFQVASGKNDRPTWIRLGDYIMVGTEDAEWRISTKANALDLDNERYSAYGSNDGFSANMGADIVFMQKGNGLRLIYQDNWGLQNMELTITNPDIMDGSFIDMVSMTSPEPSIFALKSNGDIVNLCVDRVNSVQAFSRWTFDDQTPISIFVLEDGTRQVLCALVTDGISTFLAEFDTYEDEDFADCGLSYENGVTIVQNSVMYDSLMTANPFDTIMQDGSVTIGDAKNVSKIIFRCLDTGHITTYYNEKDMTTTRVPVCCDKTGTYIGGLADHAVNVNGGTTRDLMITVKSVGDEPMTLLAMAYDVRTNRNGAS